MRGYGSASSVYMGALSHDAETKTSVFGSPSNRHQKKRKEKKVEKTSAQETKDTIDKRELEKNKERKIAWYQIR